MPSGEDEAFQSVVGLESHTTRHLPSRTIGSVSFCAPAMSLITAQLSISRREFTMVLLLWQRGFESRHRLRHYTSFPVPSLVSSPPHTRLTLWNFLIGSRDLPCSTETPTNPIKSKPSFAKRSGHRSLSAGLILGWLYSKLVCETKVELMKRSREISSSLGGESVDEWSISRSE